MRLGDSAAIAGRHASRLMRRVSSTSLSRGRTSRWRRSRRSSPGPACQRALARSGASSTGTGSRAKKTAHAGERDRPDILTQRWEWFEGQLDLDPDRLVFIGETWASTNMARTRGRSPRGERLRAAIPHGHWKTTIFVAALRNSGMVAPMVLDGPINGVAFQACVDQVLMPELRPGDIVAVDNLGSHKRPGIRASIEAAGASLPSLPPRTQPRLQPHRERLRQAQGHAPLSRRTNHRRSLIRHRSHHRRLRSRRMRQLLRRHRPWLQHRV